MLGFQKISIALILLLCSLCTIAVDITGNYRIYEVDGDTGEATLDSPSIAIYTISQNSEGVYSVVQLNATSQTHWEAMVFEQIQSAENSGFHGEADKLRAQKFEDVFTRSSIAAFNVQVEGNQVSFSIPALPDVERDDETAIAVYGKGPWLTNYEVQIENGEMKGTKTNTILPHGPFTVYAKFIDADLDDLIAEETAFIQEHSVLAQEFSPQREPADIEGVYRIHSVDREARIKKNEGYAITLRITKDKDGIFSVVETIEREREYWDSIIEAELKQVDENMGIFEGLGVLHEGGEKQLQDLMVEEREHALGEINNRRYADEARVEEIATNVRVDGNKISFLFPHPDVDSILTDMYGEKAFGWYYEAVIQDGEIKGTWASGEQLFQPVKGTFEGKLETAALSDDESLGDSE